MRPVKFTDHNALKLLHCGAEFFPDLIAAIDAARAEIYLETYIFAADETGDAVKQALIRAAGRGVVVNVLVDWLGVGRAQVAVLGRDFRAAGVHYRVFNPWFRRGAARSHRKLCVVDLELAFLGGLNINDDMRSDDAANVLLPAPRWDFAVRISGPLVYDIHLEMEAQWARVGPIKLRVRWEIFRAERSGLAPPQQGATQAALVVRDNLRNRRTIQRAYLHALGHARKSAVLANPYFAPGRKLRRALEAAALRGVDVTLLLGVGQFELQDAVAHSFYPKLLKSGVKIFEYRKTQLHGKVAVVDEDWATIGSSNYDGLSLFLNQEANIVVKDAAFAQALRAHIQNGLADSVLVRSEDYFNIPWYKRLGYDTAFWIYQAMIRVVTWGNYS